MRQYSPSRVGSSGPPTLVTISMPSAVIERTIPATSGAILKYLSGGAVRGIGPALARRIVDAFGEDTLTIMEKEPQCLAEVRGITPKKAARCV